MLIESLNKLSLNEDRKNKWKKNTLFFLMPLASIYLAQLYMTMSRQGYEFDLEDLKPTAVTLGAMALYVVNTLTDYIKKVIKQ